MKTSSITGRNREMRIRSYKWDDPGSSVSVEISQSLISAITRMVEDTPLPALALMYGDLIQDRSRVSRLRLLDTDPLFSTSASDAALKSRVLSKQLARRLDTPPGVHVPVGICVAGPLSPDLSAVLDLACNQPDDLPCVLIHLNTGVGGSADIVKAYLWNRKTNTRLPLLVRQTPVVGAAVNAARRFQERRHSSCDKQRHGGRSGRVPTEISCASGKPPQSHTAFSTAITFRLPHHHPGDSRRGIGFWLAVHLAKSPAHPRSEHTRCNRIHKAIRRAWIASRSKGHWPRKSLGTGTPHRSVGRKPGQMRIRDGTENIEVMLDRRTLQSGLILYAPKSGISIFSCVCRHRTALSPICFE